MITLKNSIGSLKIGTSIWFYLVVAQNKDTLNSLTIKQAILSSLLYL